MQTTPSALRSGALQFAVRAVPLYDLCVAWNWPYDDHFVDLLDRTFQIQGGSLYQVTPHNIDETLHLLDSRQLHFRALFDRASDVDDRFLPLVEWAACNEALRINRYEHARLAWNKAVMHKRLTAAGLNTPTTLVLPALIESPVIDELDLTIFGEQFAIKPAHGGGGRGVIACATCWDEVLAARQEFPNDEYLLQAYIRPTNIGDRTAWFRVIYCAGEIYPCWWDPLTHIYLPVFDRDPSCYLQERLSEITARIAKVAQLELFSTEIAMTDSNRFVIVDYVNDPIDLRPQSKAAEGVPDIIVEAVARRLASFTTTQRQASLPYDQ